MNITSALIIDQPWISKILNGEKDWEMRSTHCHKRGYVGLIEKGTGTVAGIAKVTDSIGPLDQQQMLDNFHRHCIPEGMVTSGQVDTWNHAWQFKFVRRLNKPVPYIHNNGAVNWVTLNDQARIMIATELQEPQKVISSTESYSEKTDIEVNLPSKPKHQRSPTSGSNQRTVILSQGNINNNHFYLRPIMDFFPKESIGGSNKQQIASHLLSVKFGDSLPVTTDIAGDKKMFRCRGAMGDFLKTHNMKAGDAVIITKVDAFTFQVEKARILP